MEKDIIKLRNLIIEMRKKYAEGINVMEYARSFSSELRGGNELTATQIAYDLQAGTYVESVRKDQHYHHAWCEQLASLLLPLLPAGGSILEVGVGEATTLSGVTKCLRDSAGSAYGFDISWSRVYEGKRWLKENGVNAQLFKGDLFNIPLADNSIDVVFSSHSLEPNGGREVEALAECIRVARSGVVLVEPIYELASIEAKGRMQHHGYVRNLKATAETFPVTVSDYRILDLYKNPLNPSGVLALVKNRDCDSANISVSSKTIWQCPVTGAQMIETPECIWAKELGLLYPKLKEIPLLVPNHLLIASKYSQ